jgi:hypothetical protein
VELAICTLRRPIEARGERCSRLVVGRRVNLGDLVEMERRGWVTDMDIRPECQLRATVYLLQQLCGLTTSEAEAVDPEDLPVVTEMLRPFVEAGSPGTGAR